MTKKNLFHKLYFITYDQQSTNGLVIRIGWTMRLTLRLLGKIPLQNVNYELTLWTLKGTWTNYFFWKHRGVLVLLRFGQFSCELQKTGSSGATESEVWIGNFNVKAWKTTEHKLHKIWRSRKFYKNSRKRAHPRP